MTIYDKKIRVLLAKSELDCHERGMRYIAKVLSAAGMEVILCRYRIIDDAVPAALQEDVDVIGLQSYSPGWMYDVSRLTEMLQERRIEDILIITGGTGPTSVVPQRGQIGVAATFGPGTPVDKIIEFIRTNVKR